MDNCKIGAGIGIENSMSWAWKKNNYLQRHPEAKELFDKWFVEYTDSQRRVMFKAKYIEDLKNYLPTKEQLQRVLKNVRQHKKLLCRKYQISKNKN